MKLLRFISPETGRAVVGELRDELIYPYCEGTDLIRVLLEKRPAPDDAPALPYKEVEVLQPYVPSVIYGIGLNYTKHPYREAYRMPVKPDVPIIFTKGPCAAAGPFDCIAKPAVTKELDYEGELALVMGESGEVAGFCTANDLTMRDLQRSEKQWARAKGFDASCPFGPWITSADEAADWPSRHLRTHVNGALRQDIALGEMIFKPHEMIAAISETNTLRPGDLILTGSPFGTGISMTPPVFLEAGDTVEVEIDGLGAIRNQIVNR